MNENEYITSDLPEAVVLKHFDHPLLSIDKTHYRAQFCFKRISGTDDLIRRYRERELQVEPYSFFQCLKEVKDRLYNG